MDKLNNIFEEARNQNSIISQEETLNLLSSKLNNGTIYKNYIKGKSMSILLTSISVLVATGILMFNTETDTNTPDNLAISQNNNETKNPNSEISADNSKPDKNTQKVESSLVTEKKPEVVQYSVISKKNNGLKPQDNNNKKEATIIKIKKINKQPNIKHIKSIPIQKKINIDGIRLMELNDSELSILGVIKEGNKYKFTAFGKSLMPSTINLKKDNIKTILSADEAKSQFLSPVFVTDNLGNKKLSLFNISTNNSNSNIIYSNGNSLVTAVSNELVNEDKENANNDVNKTANAKLKTDNIKNLNHYVFSSSNNKNISTNNDENAFNKISNSIASLKKEFKNIELLDKINFKELMSKKIIELRKDPAVDSLFQNGLRFNFVVDQDNVEELSKKDTSINYNSNMSIKVQYIVGKNDTNSVDNEEMFMIVKNKVENSNSLKEKTIKDIQIVKSNSSNIQSERSNSENSIIVKHIDINDTNDKIIDLNSINTLDPMLMSKLQKEKLLVQSITETNNFNFKNPFANLEEYEKINQLLPIAIRLDSKEIDYILWFEPTDEFISKLPTDLQTELAPEIASLRNSEKAVCGEAPIDNAHTDKWRACNGVIENLTVYPNPANENANLNFNLKKERKITITLNDLTGREIKKMITNRNCNIGDNLLNLDLSGIQSGMYYVSVTSSIGEQAVQRIIIE